MFGHVLLLCAQSGQLHHRRLIVKFESCYHYSTVSVHCSTLFHEGAGGVTFINGLSGGEIASIENARLEGLLMNFVIRETSRV